MKREYEQLHVVSDLHMGGKGEERQIFREGERLARLIDELRGRRAESIGFVLNGDIVDFLAEPEPEAFDAYHAPRRLKRIMKDASFRSVWKALGRFVRAQGRELILVLGNHDVELALPAVREVLLHRLCGDNAAARGRVRFAVEGSGFACTVGGRDVLCLHGNEVDDWNVVDFHRLLRVARARNRRRPPPDWVPNAGTLLVIQCMNEIKCHYPFVDLLKPEIEAVIPILLALDEQKDRWGARLWSLRKVLMRRSTDAARMRRQLLGHADEEGGPGGGPGAIDMPPADTRTWASTDARQRLAELMSEVEQDFRAGRAPLALVDDEIHGEFATWREGWAALRFGWGRFMKRGGPMIEVLRQAFEVWLADDRSFELDHPDGAFHRILGITSPELDIIVSGHTHLRRAIRRGHGFYMNTGTWARLIRVDPTVLEDSRSFEDFFHKVTVPTMAELDASGLVECQATVASIVLEGDRVHSRLCDVVLVGGDGVELQPVEGGVHELPAR